MIMTPGARKFALTAHVSSSVGWLGAVAAFLVLSIAGLTSHDAETVRAAYVAMNLVGQFMIVPRASQRYPQVSFRRWAPIGDCSAITG